MGEVEELREYFKCWLCKGSGRAPDGGGWGGGDCPRCHGAGTVVGPPDKNPPYLFADEERLSKGAVDARR